MNKWNEIKAVVKNVSIIDVTVNKCHATPPVFPCFSFKLRCSYWNTVKIFIHAFFNTKFTLHCFNEIFITQARCEFVHMNCTYPDCLEKNAVFEIQNWTFFFLYFRSLRFGTSCGWDFILWDRCSGVMMCAVRITPPTATPSPHFSMPSEACYALHSQSLWWPYPPTSYRYD